MAIIKAVCISEKRGTSKINVHKAELIENFGLKNDAHGGNWHRQVSLLSHETIEAFKAKGAKVNQGDFGENLIVSGINLKELPVGARLVCGNIILEVTQIGKQCHTGCEISKQVGECIMPTNGIFAKVIRGGIINEGDEIYVQGSSACAE